MVDIYKGMDFKIFHGLSKKNLSVKCPVREVNKRFVFVLKCKICKIRQNIKIFNIVLDCNMLIKEQKVEIQSTNVKNMSN